MNSLFPSRRDIIDVSKNFFDDSFDHFFTNTAGFNVDIKESDDAYTLEADLPGIAKENIQVDYKDNILTIGAHQETNKEEKDDDGHFIRKERTSQSYNRQFVLRNVKEDDITAKFDNGVLHLELPKTDAGEQPSKKIEIQ